MVEKYRKYSVRARRIYFRRERKATSKVWKIKLKLQGIKTHTHTHLHIQKDAKNQILLFFI